jgi:DNA-binding CsgD family transcriptional regulator
MSAAELLERAAELTQLTAALTAAASGRGQVCVIDGPSGVGKSRLLDECAASAEATGMRTLRTRCSELTRDYSFGVARNLFEGSIVRADAELRAILMQGPASLAEPVFGHSEAFDVFGVIHGLYWLTVNLAEQQPVAIVVDDVPWADDLSLRFFTYLAERVDDMPVALVLSVRAGDPGPESQVMTHLLDMATSPPIRPADLSEEAVEALLAKTLHGHDVDTDLAPKVFRETGGNPFLVVAVADAIRRGEDTDVTTPQLVRRRIARRLARLRPAARQLAKTGSVVGDDVSLREAVQLAGLEPDDGNAAAEELVLATILESSDPMTFAHRIVRMAIYNLLEPAERLALHTASAKLLAGGRAQPEAVAEHLLISGATAEPWVLAVLQDAGRAALRKGAPEGALRYLRHALKISSSGTAPPSVLIDLGLAEAAAGEPMSLNRFEMALDLISEPDEQADALYSLGQTLYRFGRYTEAGVAFRRGAEMFDGRDQQIRLRFEGAAWSADTHLTPTRYGPASAANVAANVDGDGPGDRAVLAVHALNAALTIPPAAEAGELAIRALGDGALLAEQTSQGAGVNLATLALHHSGRLIEANEVADATIRDACDRGARLAYAEASVVRAIVLYTRGRVNDAAADAQAAFDLLQHREHAHARTALAALVHCLIDRGDLTEATKTISLAENLLTPTPAIDAYVRIASGRLNLRRGMIDEARRDLEAAEALFGDFGTLNPASLPWRSLAGLIAHISGDGARAQSLIAEEIRLAEQFGVAIPLGLALQRRGLTESGGDALETFRQAVEVLEGTEARLHLARAHYGLGRGLRRAGQRVDARRHLGTSLDLAHRSGASGLEAEIREEMMAAGARPRRAAVTGVESLTPTELRMAQFAAEGLSNREIAEKTFVSRNTVGWHLGNVYKKLQIESREQLTLRIKG